jgi:hypothetical protein
MTSFLKALRPAFLCLLFIFLPYGKQSCPLGIKKKEGIKIKTGECLFSFLKVKLLEKKKRDTRKA